jgi:hypothetical protein
MQLLMVSFETCPLCGEDTVLVLNNVSMSLFWKLKGTSIDVEEESKRPEFISSYGAMAM